MENLGKLGRNSSRHYECCWVRLDIKGDEGYLFCLPRYLIHSEVCTLAYQLSHKIKIVIPLIGDSNENKKI